MLGPFATASRLMPTHQVLLPVLSRAACASMSTTTTRDRGDRYGPMKWAQLLYFRLSYPGIGDCLLVGGLHWYVTNHPVYLSSLPYAGWQMSNWVPAKVCNDTVWLGSTGRLSYSICGFKTCEWQGKLCDPLLAPYPIALEMIKCYKKISFYFTLMCLLSLYSNRVKCRKRTVRQSVIK